VHAVYKGVVHNRHDKSTYDVVRLVDLETIGMDNQTYTQCKVYFTDGCTTEKSLLNNGVVDNSIIDAPGLNADTAQAIAVFARQEEIDAVVFLISPQIILHRQQKRLSGQQQQHKRRISPWWSTVMT
jgi:mitofusin